jgi:tartrate-resistant acid phosphatase type 5
MRGSHFEPFVHLADLTHERALIAWGGFFFDPPSADGAAARIVEDHELIDVDGHRHRSETIGAAAPPYGHARVDVLDAATGAVAATAETSKRNHVWVRGLTPDRE